MADIAFNYLKSLNNLHFITNWHGGCYDKRVREPPSEVADECNEVLSKVCVWCGFSIHGVEVQNVDEVEDGVQSVS